MPGSGGAWAPNICENWPTKNINTKHQKMTGVENNTGKYRRGYKGDGGTNYRQNIQEPIGTWAQAEGGKGGTKGQRK